MKLNPPIASVAHMLDVVLDQQNIKNDAALARAIQVSPPAISKVRNGCQPLSATLLVKLHEATGMTTMEIKALAGIPAQ
jgi:plasmid maintenance system antidote protein VapI